MLMFHFHRNVVVIVRIGLLACHVHHMHQTLSSLTRHLKTHYFQSAYPAPSGHPQCQYNQPDSLLRFWRYINHLLAYLLTYLL